METARELGTILSGFSPTRDSPSIHEIKYSMKLAPE